MSYGLWLKPSGAVYDLLDRTIRGLARELGSPEFEPHVTLLGHLSGTEPQHVARGETLARQLQPFQAILTEPAYLDEYFRCLFLRVQETSSLMNARGLARQVFGSAEEAYMPHLSLAYGFFARDRKAEVARRLPPEIRTSFDVSAISLIRSAGDDPKDWNEVARFPMAPPRELAKGQEASS